MASEFESLGLSAELVQAVEQLGFDRPTPIQQAAIPLLLAGHDVLGQAQTGTGKTAAFVLPLLQKIKPGHGSVQALVLAPTRELAIQVAAAAGKLACTGTANVLAVYGGQSYTIQTRQLRRGVDIVVGTPGRLLDLIRQDVLDLSNVSYLVIDEADEMLEMGFIEDVETILAEVPPERQVGLFSATLPNAVRKLAERYLHDPKQVAIHPEKLTVAETEQRYYRVREDNKLAALTRLLEMEDVKGALVFARTKVKAQELADELNRRGFTAESLHGDLNQSRREWVLNRFRQHSINLLVATDVAARGLDIEDISHVFNFDMPEDVEDYVHRIGRTGRAGRKGIAITFLVPRESFRLGQIEAYTRQKIEEAQVPTKEQILAQRDARFILRLKEYLDTSKDIPERGLLTTLVEQENYNLVQIAAAAIRLARGSEGARAVDEFSAPVKRPLRKHEWSEAALDALHGKPGHANRHAPSGEYYQPKGDAAALPRGRRHNEPGMVRLWMNLGELHGVRPGDVVGAIASEVGIPGKAIGEIDIRRDHSFVDVAEKHVGKVMQSSTGKFFLRGKPVTLKRID